MTHDMKLSDFVYEYPKELIAQRPLARRDASRMMVVQRSTEKYRGSMVANLPDELSKGDVLVINDSKVIPARIFGTRSNGEPIELLIVEPHPSRQNMWRCLLKKAKRIRGGEKFFFGMQATAEAHERDGIFLLVEFKSNSLKIAMKYHGVPPLPPYIDREGRAAYTDEDRERYQTVYAKNAGSAAAPTAGLHLSDELLKKIENKGVEIVHVTLHVGIDTFAPVRKDDITDHKMHGEHFEITKDAAEKISMAKTCGHRVIAVGTTSTRALESAATMEATPRFAWKTGSIVAGKFRTDLFIQPGYEFRIVDAMLTNFHQPRSTLLVLVSAFAGREFILDCYREAIKEKYRLFSYGDCMLIL